MLPMKATLEWIGLYRTAKLGEITLYGSLWCSTYQYNPVTLEALRDHQEIDRTLISDLDAAEVRLVNSILLLGLRGIHVHVQAPISPISEEWSEHHEQHTYCCSSCSRRAILTSGSVFPIPQRIPLLSPAPPSTFIIPQMAQNVKITNESEEHFGFR